VKKYEADGTPVLRALLVARFEGSSVQTAVDCTNKINEPTYKTPETFSCAEGLDSAPNFPASSKRLKREVGICRFFGGRRTSKGRRQCTIM
jgi:hypothetical protein